MITFRTLAVVTALISAASTSAHAGKSQKCHERPIVLNNQTLTLQVEQSFADDHPTKGVITQDYELGNTATYEHTGSPLSFNGEMTVKNRILKNGKNRKGLLIEKAKLSGLDGKVVTKLTFEQTNTGTWERRQAGDTLMKGNFYLSDDQTAPDSYAGMTLALTVQSAESELPAGSFPSPGSVILQSYTDDGSYSAIGFGPGTLAHNGSYAISRTAGDIVVEETLQTIPELNFTAPYTMVYHYETPYSGTWHQNFAEGLIRFNGTFSLFATQ